MYARYWIMAFPITPWGSIVTRLNISCWAGEKWKPLRRLRSLEESCGVVMRSRWPHRCRPSQWRFAMAICFRGRQAHRIKIGMRETGTPPKARMERQQSSINSTPCNAVYVMCSLVIAANNNTGPARSGHRPSSAGSCCPYTSARQPSEA